MRNVFSKKSLKNAAWLIALALCFALIFTLVMTIDAYGETLFAPIASAGTDKEQDVGDEATFGSTTAIPGTLKAGSFSNFINANGTTASWTATEDLSSYHASTANVQVYKTDGDTKLFITEWASAADNGQFGWGVKDAILSKNASMVINYNIGTFLTNLLNNDGFTITASISCHIKTTGVSKHDTIAATGHKTATVYFAPQNSAASMDAKTMNGKLGDAVYDQASEMDADVSKNITLSKDNPIINIGCGMQWGTTSPSGFPLFGSGGVDRRVVVSNIKIKFTISYKAGTDNEKRSFKDGAAPVLTRQFVSSATETYRPNITDRTKLPVYFEGLGTGLDYNLDKVASGKGGAQLNSYTSTKLGTVNSNSYYKMAELQFNDAYDYSYPTGNKFTSPGNYAGIGSYYRSGSNWVSSFANYNCNTMVSGIKTVKVTSGSSTATFNIYGTAGKDYNSDTGEVFKAFGSYGYAMVSKRSRNQVIVTLYIRTNCEVTVNVADYGGAENNVTTTFSGIDTTAPSSVSNASNFNITDNTYMFGGNSSSFNSFPWYKDNKISLEVNVKGSVDANPYGSANVSPVLWFYTVKKADYYSDISSKLTVPSASSVLGSNNYKNIIPIGFGNAETFNFDFDFTTGKARGYGLAGYTAGNPSSIGDVSGSGYYQFVFYAMDAAGNISTSTKAYYIKVDCEKPEYDVDYSFVKNGNITHIPFSENGTTWATGETTLKLVFDKVNISGVSLLFNDNANPSNRFMIVVNRDNNNNNGQPLGWYDGTRIDYSSNSKTFTVVSRTGNTQVTVTYNETAVGSNQGAEIVFTFQGKVGDMFPTVAWVTEFTAYTGIYDSPDAIATEEQEQQNPVWKNVNSDWKAVNVLIDRNNPSTPVVTHEYLQETVNDDSSLSLVDGANGYVWDKIIRQWYTEAYNITADTIFNDSILNIEAYKDGLKICYGVKYIRTASDLAALWNGDQDVIASMYKNFRYDNDAWKENFGTATALGADAKLDLNIDLIASRNAGMRVVYIWAVDQAGNCSDIAIKYILADTQNYTITSEVRANAQLESRTASIAQRKGTTPSTSFKRGETVSFDLTLAAGYVPYLFVKTGNDTDVVTLLENYQPTNGWTLNAGAKDFEGIIDYGTYNALSYVVDSNVDLGSLHARTKFTFSHRKVVGYEVINIANNKVTLHYNSKTAVIPLSYSDNASKERFVFRYVDADGNVLYKMPDGSETTDITLAEGYDEDPALSNPVYFQALALGTYKVRIYIPQYDDSYVTENYTSKNGVQTFENCTIDVEIRQGEVTITVQPTQTMYGDKIVLSYKPEGFDPAAGALLGEELVGSLTLKGINNWKNTLLDVGEYEITYDTPFAISDNYKVTFEGNKHTVTQRPVSITTWAQSKYYGDNEPTSYVFGVNSTQFEWFTSWGPTYTVDRIVEDIFKDYNMHSELGTLNDIDHYLFDIGRGSGITRALSDATEIVPVGDGYDYIVDTKLFSISGNFSLSAQNTQKFNILRKRVVLDVSGGETLLPKNSSYDPSTIVPAYRPTSEDGGALSQKIQNEIGALLAGKLSLSTYTVPPTTDMPDKYGSWLWHEVILDASASTRNIEFVLGDDVIYIIGFAAGNAIFVRLKSDATLSFMFGTQWTDGLLNFADIADKFDITSEDAVPEFGTEFDNIDWTIALRNIDFGTYIPVGSHQVTISEAKLSKDGVALDGYSVLVESFNINVTAAPIVVRPVSATQYKVYGDAESVYGIDFEIVTIGGRQIASDGSYAGISYQTILSQIKGEFARGQYAKSGNFSTISGRYSTATDDNGIIYGTDGEYYGYAERSAFGSDNSSFTVVTDIDETVRFYVMQKTINLNAAEFVGVSRAYTGDTKVNYGKVVPYDISASLVQASDDVQLSMTSEYTDIGSLNEATDVSIRITNIKLTGKQKDNYKLEEIDNTSFTSTAELYNGANKVSHAEVSDSVSVVISYINNNIDISNTLHIQILMGSIAVRKSDFTITKQYDNTIKLDMSSVSIRDYTDENGYGTTTLYNVWDGGRGNMSILEGVSYPKSAVNDSYILNSIVLFFPIKGAKGLLIINNNPAYPGDYDDPTVQVAAETIKGVDGIKITLNNVKASITKRILGVNSFESITPTGRAYNATGVVNTSFVFADNALAEGETASTVGLTLMASIDGNDYGIGDHAISFEAVGEERTDTKLRSNNYIIDIEALNSYYFAANSLKVSISRAKLMPNIEFGEVDEEGNFNAYKDYDGKYDVPYRVKAGGPLTTLEYARELAGELAKFSIVGTPEYKLSANGELDMNVALDANGNVILHNVMVIGLQIAEDGTNYLRNYEIYGERYSGGEYVRVGSVVKDVIEDFEMRGAFMVRKKTLNLLVNNVDVKDKVYDGTRNADIVVDLTGSGIVEGHEVNLGVVPEGLFAKSIVSDNVTVQINISKLIALDADGEVYIKNYVLEEYKERRISRIVPRPIGVTVDLGVKTYDGSAKIPNSALDILTEGIADSEKGAYAVLASGGAYYLNKNVEYDTSGETSVVTDKNGVIYNPVLHSNRGMVNYQLTNAVKEYAGEGYIAYSVEGKMYYNEKYTGDTNAEGVIYYYPLPVADQYIDIDSSYVEAAMEKGAIVGRYVLDGKEVYAVKSEYKGETADVKVVDGTMPALTYVKGTGRIERKKVYISSSGVNKVDGSQAFTKMFDGTSKFFGVEDVDFYYDNDGISGVVEADKGKVELLNITGEFDKADPTANYVIFTAQGIDGAEAANYIIDSASMTAKIRGSIQKRKIISNLKDGEIVYGENVNLIEGDIAYRVLGNKVLVDETSRTYEEKEYDLDLWNGGLFMSFANYVEMMNYGVDGYKDNHNLNVFVKNKDGSYTPSEITDIEHVEYYIMLSKISSLPTAKAKFTVTKPSAGTSADYVLVGGVAVNYAFVFEYKDGADCATITVKAKDLFVATDGTSYTQVYGSADQMEKELNRKIALSYLDSNGNSGIAASETPVTVFGSNVPVAKIGVFNSETNVITPIEQYPAISADLEDNETYVIYFATPDGVEDYSQIIKNYNIHLGGSIVVADGAMMTTYDGFTLRTSASAIDIVLPSIPDVAIGTPSANNTFNVTYDGSNLTGSALIGAVKQGDDIYIVDSAENQARAINAGEYTGYIVVERAIESGSHGYKAKWRSSVVVTISVGKASPGLNVRSSSKYYDGEKFEYAVSGGDSMITYLVRDGLNIRKEDVNIEYFRQIASGKYEKVTEMRDAATYLVRASLKDSFKTNNPNYNENEIATGTYTIIRAIVNVTIDREGYKVDTASNGGLILGAVYDKDKTYAINYTVSMAAGTPAGVLITGADTKIVFANEINSSGRYLFNVGITAEGKNAANYNIVGGGGMLELTTTNVSDSNISVELSKDIVANRIVAHEVYDNTATASDIELWSKVDQYMPHINQNASIAAIVRLSLYYGNNIVSLNGSTATVEVSLPENIDNLNDFAVYAVTANGGLERLTDYQLTEDGKLRYTTDYLGALVFVDLTPNGLPTWAIALIVAGSLALVITLAVTFIGLAVKKSKLKKLV